MPSKKVAIVQSNYIPWKGYFDLINTVDEFVLYDDAQYTRRDWRNRNKIKTSQGSIWLTIPVEVKGKYTQKISETLVQGTGWRKKHWASIANSYSKSPHYKDIESIFKPLYLDETESRLSQINYKFIHAICSYLKIQTKISWSMDYKLQSQCPSGKLLELCEQAKADEYLSGPKAKSYLDTTIFEEKNISVNFYNYSEYPEYNQRFTGFDHFVTILDLLFETGPEAHKYMNSF